MGVTLIAGEPDESTESRLINLALEVGLKKLGYAAPDPSTAVGKPNTNIVSSNPSESFSTDLDRHCGQLRSFRSQL